MINITNMTSPLTLAHIENQKSFDKMPTYFPNEKNYDCRLKSHLTSSEKNILKAVVEWAEGKKEFFKKAVGGRVESSIYAQGVCAALSDLQDFINKSLTN